MICPPIAEPQRTIIFNLITKANSNAQNDFYRKINDEGYTSINERKYLNLLECPPDLVSQNKFNSISTHDLLSHLVVSEFDFDLMESKYENQAIESCRELLFDSSVINGKNLWSMICKKANEVRQQGGINREDLLNYLRKNFEFRDFPEYSSDWEKIRSWTDSELNVIRTKIGGDIQINREKVIDDLEAILDQNNFLAVIGPPGTGKTALSKMTVKKCAASKEILFFNSRSIHSGYFESFASVHQLHHSFEIVMQNGRHNKGIIIIDSLEKLSEETDYLELSKLFHIVHLNEPSCNWKLIITCRDEDWERTQSLLKIHSGSTIEWKIYQLNPLKYSEIKPILNAYPNIHSLYVRPHLQNILSNLKILDILVNAVLAGNDLDPQHTLGESDLILWFWKTIVRQGQNGALRSSLLKKIGEIEADRSTFELSESDLSHDELDLVIGLNDILSTDIEHSRITFSHDLFADWSRFEIILANENDLNDFMKNRFTNPHWHKALRLYGIYLLEKKETLGKWKKLINENLQFQNLFLESLIFSSNSFEYLNKTWPLLEANEGKLLRELLKRFLHITTIPNPDYVSKARELGVAESEASTWERLPLWQYWISMLFFLAGRSEDIADLAHIETSKIAFTWLRFSPNEWLARKEAAKLALKMGWYSLSNSKRYYDSEQDSQLPYKAVLEAYLEEPDQVCDFSLVADYATFFL
jgi:hypothetical protein